MYLLWFTRFLGSDFQEEEVTAEFLAGKVPEIVYKKATEAVPGTVLNCIYFLLNVSYHI